MTTHTIVDIGLDERRRFARAMTGTTNGGGPTWDMTSVAVLDVDALDLIDGCVRDVDEVTYGEADRSRVPWVHLPTLVVPCRPVVTTYPVLAEGGRRLAIPEVVTEPWHLTWAIPHGLHDGPTFVYPDETPDEDRTGFDVVSLTRRTETAIMQSYQPWERKVLAHPDAPDATDDMVRWHALVALIATGRLVVTEPDTTRPERRRMERARTSVQVIRPARQGDSLAAFLPASFRPRSCWRDDGRPKATLDAPTAKARAASIGAEAYPCPTGEHPGWHVGNRS